MYKMRKNYMIYLEHYCLDREKYNIYNYLKLLTETNSFGGFKYAKIY